MGYDVKCSQNRLLDMATIIEEILDKHDIPHTIIYGTLLGAVRNGGFIPWDDDFDFCIFDDVYDDAIRILRAEMPKDLFLEDKESEPLFFHAWAHVKDLKTEALNTAFLQDNAYAHKGLSVDLYRMKKVRLSDLYSETQKQVDIYIRRRRELGLMSDEEYKQRMTTNMEVKKRWFDAIHSCALEQNPDGERFIYSNIYTSFFVHEIDDFFPLKKYEFENIEFWGPNKAEKMLTHWYGNYMELPPEDQRRSHYDKVIFLS